VSAVIRRPITTTEDQSTTFIELFFDLVCCVTEEPPYVRN